MAGGGAEASSRRVRAFKRWMKSHGFECSDALIIRDCQDRGLSVAALRRLCEGDVVATIPKQACLTVKTSGARDIVDAAALDGYLGLSAAIMFERSLGDRSPWAPYLNLLPYLESLPLVWSPQEVDSLLQGTELHKTVKEDMELIYQDWKENILPLMDLEPFQLDPRFFGLRDYFAAKTLIASRSFEIDDFHGFGMVPLADLYERAYVNFLNHECVSIHCRFNHKTAAEDVHFTSVSPHSDSETEAESGGSSGLTNMEDDGSQDDENTPSDISVEQSSIQEHDSPSALEMIMIKDVEAGDEVYNTYGLLGNAALLHRYGFTEPDNPFDIVNIDMELVVQWCLTLFSSRYSRARISLWRRLGYSGCVSEDSEYFEISFDGEPQIELLLLCYIMFLPETSYRELDLVVSTSKDLEELKGDQSIFSSRGSSKLTSEVLMNENVVRAILSLTDIRELLYGKDSLEDDIEALKRCCSVRDKKLYHSLILRISERTILMKLRSRVVDSTRSINRKRTSARMGSRRT